MTSNTFMQIIAVCLVALAALTDMRSRRIPNWLTLAGVAAGLIVNTVAGGFAGLRLSFEGMILGFGSYLFLYCLRAMGAGDVKLMAAVGAIVGPSIWISVFVATALAGGVLALGLVVAKRRVRTTLWNTFFIVNELAHFRAPFQRRSDLDVKDRNSLNMPHGVAIAAGTAAVLLLARV